MRNELLKQRYPLLESLDAAGRLRWRRLFGRTYQHTILTQQVSNIRSNIACGAIVRGRQRHGVCAKLATVDAPSYLQVTAADCLLDVTHTSALQLGKRCLKTRITHYPAPSLRQQFW
jgi:hypothetical protein